MKTDNCTKKNGLIGPKKDKHELAIVFSILFCLALVMFGRIIFGVGNLWEDFIYQEFPKRIFARNSLLSGEFPFWNPFTFSGMPFFADLQAGVLYPFNLILSLLPLGTKAFHYMLQLFIILHFFVAGATMYIYTRYRSHSAKASLFAAIGYMFCGFFITHIVHNMMLNILAWLPLIFLLIDKGTDSKSIKPAAIAGIILGLSAFAGHPQITFYEFLFIGSYALFKLITNRSEWKYTVTFFTILFGIALGIASLQYLPSIELSKHSARVDWTYEMASEGSFSWAHFLTWLMPKMFGSWAGPDSNAPQFWLEGPHYGYYTYWDTCFYMGIGILLFGFITFRHFKKDPFIRYAVIWTSFTIMIALGSYFFVYKLFFDFIPGFGSFRAPARLLFTLNFLLPLLAARTFDELIYKKDNSLIKQILITLVVFSAIGLLAISGFFKNLWPILEQKTLANHVISQGGILIFIILSLAIPIFLFQKKLLKRSLVATLILLALIVDLFIFGMGHHITKKNSAPKFFNENRQIALSLISESKKEIFRTNARQFILEPNKKIVRQSGLMVMKRNQGLIDNVQLLEGYNPLHLFRRLPPGNGHEHFQRTLDLLNTRFYVNPEYRQGDKDIIRLNKDRLSRAELFYDYKLFSTDSATSNFMMTNSWDYKKVLLLNKEPSLIIDKIDNNGTALIRSYNNNSITIDVKTKSNALLWLSEIWYPSWNAYVDGKKVEVLCADYSFRAIAIEAGNHTVIFKYESSLFLVGSIIAFLSTLFALIIIFWGKIYK